jgi:hypothetical protein
MPRSYFDVREDNETLVDREGLELADLKSAQIEATQSLAEMAKAAEASDERRVLAIEVRTDEGPAFKAALIFNSTRH